ncbi:hypothetical protein [Comamonas avium]|uniref:Uncharacterized protein n=1 Tax=Comamonas avium TaxID=2762231 RepID=A0ABR8SCL1_9BURK|nr:hypothetical protein [Comamonas avium]MBD7961183.1 hypothetical protein [Comamonas avium]
MSNVIGGVLLLLALVVAVMCLIGLIAPKWLKYSKTGDAPKRSRIALVLLFVPIILLGIGGSLVDESAKESSASAEEIEKPSQAAVAPAVSDQQAAEPAAETLGITPKEFKKRFNTLAKSMDLPWNADSMEMSKGPVNDTYKLVAGTGYMVAVVDKNGFITDVHTGLAAGDGSGGDAADGLILMGLVANATTDGASRDDIGKAFASLMKKAMASIDKPNAAVQKISVGNRTYSATANRLIGFTLSIAPKES